MTTTIFIDGGAGTTGLEIRERLADRPGLALLTLPEERRKDASARREALNDADIVVLCLPDDAAREAVSLIDNPRTRVIDASTAHRTAPGWVYGFPELSGRQRVAEATRVSNPGCYSTGFIALVAPLVRAGFIPHDWPLTCNAVSGYSGGGKAMIADYESAGAAAPAWSTYALGLGHKHVPEMRAHCGLTYPPLFVPAVVDTLRGMIVEVPLMLGAMPGTHVPATLRATLKDFYAGSPVVRVIDAYDPATLAVERLANTDRLDLFVFGSADGQQARLVAALDNLGKGAAGAAVQSLNLMAGLPEADGLRL
ncbi:N-acetyl-gamma-glutamyl-phosphate reductase [Sphingomonas nostoxanthinifaciens]|uniref:N-acetyl-gamma-glutamyl-phosphate reductase n=1 Tax=Sphingomonas nostoxanthinifaciens TaxID=2872652 RepID=UPI001CC1FCAA|nr:N-acetyl-gamma-glutamyl-phosphate reductase [Sphingomonas nostoxanthinifaciens]UAK22948.1 N-acetyl-gamma-glutamyl-phosphate reductase [Sphingomonas nostoxanthinifaciens]